MRAERAQKSLDTSRRAGYNIQVSGSPLACGFSSSGRASASQAEGGEFEPRNPLHSQRQDVCSGAFLFWALRCCLREDRSCGRCAAAALASGRRVRTDAGKIGMKKPRCVGIVAIRADSRRPYFFDAATSSGGSFRNLTGFLSHPSCRFSQVRSPSADT